ncbi:RdgB/HAM1 family non-canonical purine NTP pyrophosphatase [Aquihabitans sp. McL0605]|uniref:RdgB/HAM1 family non-canonical purine NTP pyrophosphatase n=1 Tax=Aquihabitans sp. McL0605 TaxID=3415671 RepID=UPI003CEA9053
MAERTPIVLASANPKKAAEIVEILGSHLELVPRPPEVPDVVEDDDTFEGNSRLKAVALVEATGLAAVADDSGLEVDALDGAPGVWSARYAGEGASDQDNVDKLLAALADRPDPADRTARFRAVVVLRYPDGSEVVAAGAVEGHIAEAPRGPGGFGYDPVFIPVDGDGRTFGEMSQDEKHAISHRGRALRSLLAQLDHRTA